jgi:hypothetical protein
MAGTARNKMGTGTNFFPSENGRFFWVSCHLCWYQNRAFCQGWNRQATVLWTALDKISSDSDMLNNGWLERVYLRALIIRSASRVWSKKMIDKTRKLFPTNIFQNISKKAMTINS